MRTPTGPIIEVYADIWCPFAHVGLRAVEEQRARAGRADVAIWVRAWPLELVNGGPLDPVMTKEHADDLRAQVVPQLFHDLDVDHFPPSTLEALALATDTQEAVLLHQANSDAQRSDGAVFEPSRTPRGRERIAVTDRLLTSVPGGRSRGAE